VAKLKINFAAELLDFYGAAIQVEDRSVPAIGTHPDGSPKYPLGPMRLMKACTNALGGFYEKEGNPTHEVKQKRWRIGCKVAKAAVNGTGEVTLKADEVTEILACVNYAYPPQVAGVVRAMLDPSDEDEQFLEGLGKAPAAPAASSSSSD
jgi:hypothetical protein